MMKTKIEVRNSGIWQLSSVVIANAGECLIVDPAYFPRELDELSSIVTNLGEAKSVVFTHVHWDHVVGWSQFPSAKVWGSHHLATAVQNLSSDAQEQLKSANEFDARWYVQRPTPLAWPQIHALSNDQSLTIGDCQIQILETPGHSKDGLALLLQNEGILITGDYLSPCEIPFVENIIEYQNTLKRFLKIFPNLKKIIPGHGPCLTPEQATKIAQEDLEYLVRLEAYSQQKDTHLEKEIFFPRAKNAPGMQEAHLENCKNARHK